MQRLWIPMGVAFLSGMAALVYEIVWMRAFTPVFGLSIHATTAVLCSFMAGLGLGSALAPRVIARWRGSIWLLYALLEVGIGLASILIPHAIGPITQAYVAAAVLDSAGLATVSVRFGLSFAVMVIPTFFMGLTLPVLIHACSSLVVEDPVTSQRVGTLYGVNTVGAAIGCVLVGFVLLYQLGVRGTIHTTAVLNFGLAGLVAVLYGRRRQKPASMPVPASAATPAEVASPYSPGLVLALYALIGFTSFGYELSWFRVLVFYLQSATYSFSIMLSLFLLGLGLGSLFFSQVVEPRIRNSDPVNTAFGLALVQVMIAVLGASTGPLFTILKELWGPLIRLTGAGSWLVIVLQKSIIAGVLILPATFLMGVAFPLVARLYKVKRHKDSTTMGMVYASNTAGSILGSLLTGFVFFELLGTQMTIVLLAALNLGVGTVLAFPALRRALLPRAIFASLAAALIAIVALTSPRILIERFERGSGSEIIYYSESAADIMYVMEMPDGNRTLHFNDGRGTSATLRAPNYVNRLLAYSAMVMNPEAKDVLVISMGCGNTAAAFAKFDIDRLDIVDISAGAFEAAEYFFTNDGVMNDPRAHTYVEDGRNFLLKSKRKYDVIQIELPSIHADGVVTLYTREFYELAQEKLRDGGVLSQWIDAAQARRELSYTLIHTMREVFPGSVVWAAKWAWWITGVKGDAAPRVDYARARALFERPSVAADVEALGSDFEDVMAKVVSSGEILQGAVGSSPVVTDDRTIVDFEIPRLTSPGALGGGLGHSGAMRGMFLWYWRSTGSDLQDQAMIPFYAKRHQELVDRSLDGILLDFPEPALSRIRASNGSL